MSGTSVDGVDAALIDIQQDRVTTIATIDRKYNSSLRTSLLTLNTQPSISLVEYIKLDNQVAAAFAETTLALLALSGHPAEDIVAIGSHGQTIFHLPNGTPAGTIQLGDPNIIAFRSQIDTVADFRRADIARGGQGAPLVPAFHAEVFKCTHSRAVLNLGGIANLTVLSSSAEAPIAGFDTGPANTLLDAWVQKNKGQPFDADGAWAHSGSTNASLLHSLLSDPYFSIAPPKSTGADYFNLEWLMSHLQRTGTTQLSTNDVQATLMTLTVSSIAASISEQCPVDTEILLCGGGARNRCMINQLGTTLGADYKLRSTNDAGIDADFCEAIAFAWLAWRFVNSQPGNLPAATGASDHAILGGLYRATPGKGPVE